MLGMGTGVPLGPKPCGSCPSAQISPMPDLVQTVGLPSPPHACRLKGTCTCYQVKEGSLAPSARLQNKCSCQHRAAGQHRCESLAFSSGLLQRGCADTDEPGTAELSAAIWTLPRQ